MKTYEQLTDEQKKAAEIKALESLLRAILEGGLRFDDKPNEDDLQARIDKAVAEADAKQTPWFAHEYILDTCRDNLEGMARADAEDSLYSEANERVVSGIC